MKGWDDAIIEFDERRKAMKERMEEVSEVDERKLAANLKRKMQCVREPNFQDARDKSFAVSTRFSELMVEGDTLYDYALLSIVAQERKNTCNQMPAVGAPVVLTGDPGPVFLSGQAGLSGGFQMRAGPGLAAFLGGLSLNKYFVRKILYYLY